MEVIVVGEEDGVFIRNPHNKIELAKFNVPASACCIVEDEIIISHRDKPILFTYKIHRSIQTPKKIIMPDLVSALCASPIGSYLLAGIGMEIQLLSF